MTFEMDTNAISLSDMTPNFGWTCAAIANFSAQFIDFGGFVVEIDGLTASVLNQGRGGFPRRGLQLAPVDYVRAIVSAGLEFEGAYCQLLAGESVVGASDYDEVPIVDKFDHRFNARTNRRLRVRTIDSHLKNLPGPSVLVFGGYGVRPEMLRSGHQTILEHRPIIAVRPTSRHDLNAFRAALHELDCDYTWMAPLTSEACDGLSPYRYYLARPISQNERLEPFFASYSAPSSLSAAYAVRPLRISPDDFIASRGFYPVERNDRVVWRWAGALPRCSAMVEAPFPGWYEVHLSFINNAPGAMESIEGLRINGMLLTDRQRQRSDLSFTVAAWIDRYLLIEIDCPHRHYVTPDPRLLSVALSEIQLRRLQG